jgi:hypothetical protein
MRVKAREYMSLADLHTYMVASQDEPRLWVWHRLADATGAFSAEPVEVVGLSAQIDIAPLSISLVTAGLYRGIGIA